MKKSILFQVLFILLCLISSQTRAQIVINKYAAVLGYEPCNNALSVDTATGFNIGDTVLMIQMKGAIIDTSNTASFGNMLNYDAAGNYEYNVVKSVTANVIALKYTIVRNYNIPNGKVQLVKVPSFVSYTVTQSHTCLPWNGTKGGIFAIYVQNALTLNDNIQVSEMGFKGGINNQTPTVVGPMICGVTKYFLTPGYDSGSMKGEGIADVSLSKSHGRGKLANGGGGGNAHNAGGAGGSNGTAGGAGGSEFYGCNWNYANNVTGGVGGVALGYDNLSNKIFLGGGGGSAQANNLTVSNGGHGGGICIITAGSIQGNNNLIAANGKDASQCVNNGSFGSCHDGSAGGGGAGTILLNVTTVTGALNIEAKGGKGGNEAANAGYGEVGPGGGGSGGILWVKSMSVPPGIVSHMNGGANGIILYNNATWGAQPGQPGALLTSLNLAFPVDTFNNADIDANFAFTRTSCYTFNFTDQSSSATGTINSWSWDFSDPPGSALQNPSHTFPGYGTYDVTLTVNNNNGCSGSITQQVTIPYVHFAKAGADISVCSNKPATLTASGGITYSWNPPAGLGNPNAANTSVSIDQSNTYVVTVTDNMGCTDKDTVLVNIDPGPDLDITSDGSGVSCYNKTILLHATGADHYNWSPGIYCDDSTSASPLVNPPVTTTFTVTGTNANGCSATDTVTIIQHFGNSELFMPNAFSPNHDGRNEDIKPMILCDFTLDVFAIYNRWGQKVFATSKADDGWDGLINGKNADTGVYFYYITGKKNNGNPVKLKGDISLIR